MGSLLAVLLLVPRPVLSGPEQTAPSATYPFLVHYTSTGTDAVADLADVRAVIQGIDTVMAHWVDEKGMRAPLPDGGVGGDPRIDVYLRRLDGPRGNTWPEDVGKAERESAWIELDPRTAQQSETRLAAAAGHETHHAIQYAYSTTLPRWIYEATATFVEHTDFGDAALDAETEKHRQAIQSHPERPLDLVDGSHEYDEMTFVAFLDGSPLATSGYMARLWSDMVAQGDAVAGLEKDFGPIEGVLAGFGSWLGFAPPSPVQEVSPPASVTVGLSPLTFAFVHVDGSCPTLTFSRGQDRCAFSSGGMIHYASAALDGGARSSIASDVALARGRTSDATSDVTLDIDSCLPPFDLSPASSMAPARPGAGGCGCGLGRAKGASCSKTLLALALLLSMLLRRTRGARRS